MKSKLINFSLTEKLFLRIYGENSLYINKIGSCVTDGVEWEREVEILAPARCFGSNLRFRILMTLGEDNNKVKSLVEVKILKSSPYPPYCDAYQKYDGDDIENFELKELLNTLFETEREVAGQLVNEMVLEVLLANAIGISLGKVPQLMVEILSSLEKA